MKKNFLEKIVLLLFFMFLISCSENEQPKKTEQNKPGQTNINNKIATQTGDAIRLNFKLVKDKTYFMKININQEMTQTIDGQKQALKQKMGVGYAFKVLENKADSVYFIEVKFSSIYQEVEGPNGKISFDSKKKDNIESPFSMIFPKIIGKKLVAELKSNGEIISVKGEKELVDAVLKALDVTNETIREELGRSIRQQFGANSIKDMLEHSWAYLGNQSRKIGESWKQSHSISGGLPITVFNTWTLNEVNKDEIILGLKSALKTNEKNPYTQSGIMRVKYDLSGSQDGSYKLDKNSCWLLRAEINQKISGKVILEKSKENPEEKNWPLSVVSKYIIEAVE
jgi:hypothetical protein